MNKTDLVKRLIKISGTLAERFSLEGSLVCDFLNDSYEPNGKSCAREKRKNIILVIGKYDSIFLGFNLTLKDPGQRIEVSAAVINRGFKQSAQAVELEKNLKAELNRNFPGTTVIFQKQK